MIHVTDATEPPSAVLDESDMPRVAAIGVHPVKSMRGLDPASWRFDARGPELDRRWMLVDETGRFVSLREEPALARFRVRLRRAGDTDGRGDTGGDGSEGRPERLPELELAWEDDRFDLVPRDPGTDVPTTAILWGAERVVIDEGDEAAHWISTRIGRAVRLQRHLPDRDSWTQPDPPAEAATTGLSDGYPVLVLATSTIAAAVGPDVSPRRFRANVLIAGAPPHAEDGWGRVRLGDLVLELVKPCVRCVATTVDPATGARTGTEPLSTLARTRLWKGKPVLGWNALVRRPGVLRVGTPLEIESKRPATNLEIRAI